MEAQDVSVNGRPARSAGQRARRSKRRRNPDLTLYRHENKLRRMVETKLRRDAR